jgi:hypothetical protein
VSAQQKPILEVRVEAICERGCRSVWEAIDALEQGSNLPETLDLTAGERAWVLAELRAVMTVYGERCRLDQQSGAEHRS